MKDKKKQIIAIAILVVIVVIVATYFVAKYQTYDHIEISKTYENHNKDNANYLSCMGGILRYSRDGIALLNKQGEEKWNQPCQMNHPIVEVGKECVVVADKGGTSIIVLGEKGLKGEIQTTRPIEKIAVSSQGIVSAILKDEEKPKVMCYDLKGNVLVEHKVSINSMGYPMDVALSEDGNTMLVSYLKTDGKSIIGKVAYYYFGKKENSNKNHVVHEQEFENTIIPITAFLDKDTSLLVADEALIFYKGLTKPKEALRVAVNQEIQSVAYSDKLVAVVTRNEGSAAYKLHIYNKSGKELSVVDVDKEYTQLKVEENQVLMYDGQMSSIYLKNGVHKFEGKSDENILEIFPLKGINKYMIIDASGFHEVRLEK